MDDIIIRLRALAAMADPTSDIGLSINLLIKDVEAIQKRKASQRERTRRCVAKKREANVSLTVSLTPHPNTEKREPNVSLTSSIEEHSLTKHVSTSLNIITGKRRKRTSASLPVDWELPASYVKLGLSLGMTQDDLAVEGLKFKSHHLAKDTKNSNWYFAWQGWCLGFVQRQKKHHTAKPLTLFQRNQIDRENVLAPLAEFAYGPKHQSQDGGPLGSPDYSPFPASRRRPDA